MIKKILSIKNTFLSFIPFLEKKTFLSIYLCLFLGLISFLLDSTSIISLSRLEILSNFNKTPDYQYSSVFVTLVLLFFIALFNIIKTIAVSRSSSLIASDITKNIYKSHIEKKSQFKDNFSTENIGKNVTRELIRGAYACLLLLPINVLSLFGILLGLQSGLGSKAIQLTLLIIFVNLFLVLLFGNFANKLQYIGTKSEKELEIISKEIINESEEILIANLAERKLNKLKDINYKSRVNISYANSCFRVPGTLYPVINIAIILIAIKLKFLSYEILVPFIYSMQRGNLSFSSFISSLTSLIGSRRQLELVTDALYNKREINSNYLERNKKNKILKQYVNFKNIQSIYLPLTDRVSISKDILNNETENIKYYDSLLNFHFTSNPIVFYGDSGSGKSTYLKRLIGLTGAKKDECLSIKFKNIVNNKISICDLNGYYMSQDIVFPRSTLKEYLNAFKNSQEKDTKELFRWNKKFQLLWPEIINYNEWINKDLSESSYGEVKRIKLLKAYYGSFNWIALDEPTSGLDGDCVNNVVNAINDLSKRAVVLVCTHEERLIKNSMISLKITKN